MSSEHVAKVRECQDCGKRMLRLYAMQSQGLRANMAPAVSDDASWEELRGDHTPGCSWFETRGHRRVAGG